jgi:hypothetical protein
MFQSHAKSGHRDLWQHFPFFGKLMAEVQAQTSTNNNVLLKAVTRKHIAAIQMDCTNIQNKFPWLIMLHSVYL